MQGCLRFLAGLGWGMAFYGCVISGAYAERLEITVANNTGSALSDYTVRLDIDATNAPGFDFTNNGDDIIVWDADVESSPNVLDFYVQEVDSVNSTAIVWVRLPSVPVSPPDTQFFLDYNRTDVADVATEVGSSSPLSDAASTFTSAGLQYHSQPHTDANPGPESQAEGEALFDFNSVTANTNYGCTILSSLSTNHRSVFPGTGDYGLAISSQFIVPSDALYEFRFGGDFGHGGEIMVDQTVLEASWSDDLWWANNWGNADVLQGSVFLTEGAHTIRVLGFERCCDGPAQLQFRYDSDSDGSLADESFNALASGAPGVTLLAPSCPVADVTFGSVTTVPVTLARFTSRKIGPFIRVEWDTADETFNAGFNLWTVELNGNEEVLAPLNKRLIKSRSFDSMDTQKYKAKIKSKTRQKVSNLVISSVDINGDEEFFGPFEVNQSYGGDLPSVPIQWSKLSEEYRTTRIKQGYQRFGRKWIRKRDNLTRTDPRSAHVAVSETGIYRVSYEELLRASVDLQGFHRNTIAVTRDGKAIPRVIKTDKDKVFGPNSEIHFVGVKPKFGEEIYQIESQYQISVDKEKALSVPRLRDTPSQTQDWYYQRQTIDEDKRHLMFSPLASPWVNEVIFRTGSSVTRSFQFNLPKLVNSVSGELHVRLGGISNATLKDFNGDGVLDPHHSVSVKINGVAVKAIAFKGHQPFVDTFSFESDVLKEGVNNVELVLEANGYAFDVVAVDEISLKYPVKVAKTSSHEFEVDNGSSDGIQFSGNSKRDVFAYAYLKNHNLIRLKVTKDKMPGVFQSPFVASAEAKYFIGKTSDLKRPSSIIALDGAKDIVLRDVDLIIVSHPNLITQELKEYSQVRDLQGISNQIVDTDSIQNKYGADVPLNLAIKRFLNEADSLIRYKHVLLVGGHTFDYAGRLNQESVNFIPTFYVPIGSSRFTPSDQPFVDLDQDGYPDKTIGRWPVRQSSEVAVIVNKSLRWIEQRNTSRLDGHKALLLADKAREYDFSAELDLHFSKLNKLPFVSETRVSVDSLLNDTAAVENGLNSEVQAKVADGLAELPTWVFYNGHASPSAWSYTQMLRSSSVKDLKNSGAPVLITSLGCYTTYYEGISNNSLAHQLLFAGDNAAVAIHGPAVVGGYENQRRLANLIAQEMGVTDTLGGSIQQGMRLLPVNYRNAIPNWALLGDPTLPVR
ncbi:MAG: CCXG family PEP-CTERM protein [Acidiferrobacterales bacterium]|nr:CCXG family PEP-CTERM protein [Acidiferrobacterales bacterium]